MRRICLLLAGLIGSLVVSGNDRARTIPAKAFWDAGFPWLTMAGSEISEPFEIPVYQLSCASCLETFGAILGGEEEPAPLFFLNTSKPEDREVARVMIATVLAQPNDETRREKFRELLGAYLAAPEIYLNDLPAWQAACVAAWGEDAILPPEAPNPWASALNQLLVQNRLLGWLDVYQTPSWLSMDEDSRRVPPESALDEYARQFRMLMLTEPSLQPILSDAPVRVHQINFDAGKALSSAEWQELAGQIEEGALWLWTKSRANSSKTMEAWRAQIDLLPDLPTRREFFLTTFQDAAKWKKKGKWSFVGFLKSMR